PSAAGMSRARASGLTARYGNPLIEAADPAALMAAYRLGEPFAPMFQELIPGGDDCLWTVGSYLDGEGRALGVFCGRKLLQAPAGVGTCRVGEAVWDAVAVE